MERELLTEEALEASAVVANCRMNRERGIVGKNSYAADLHLNPLEFLEERLLWKQEVRWLDLCCGTGRAMFQAEQHFHERVLADRIAIHDVDLVEMFDIVEADRSALTLEAVSLRDWTPNTKYDLITYVGQMQRDRFSSSFLSPCGKHAMSDLSFCTHRPKERIIPFRIIYFPLKL